MPGNKFIPDISVVIPVFNEVKTIGSVLEIVLFWGKAREIIVVDDGSTDDTVRVVKKFSLPVKLVTSGANYGKSHATALGIAAAKGSYILMLDGDILGLTRADLDAVTKPLVSQNADMVMGLPRFWSAGSFEPWKYLTGIRVFRTDPVRDRRSQYDRTGYGLELYLNNLFSKEKVVKVKLHHVYVLSKWAKWSATEALKSYILEGTELLNQTVKNQKAGIPGELNASFKNAVSYLKDALRSLGE